LARDGLEALKNKYADGVVEILNLFAELLGLDKAGKTFRTPHHHIWGKSETSTTDELQFGPMVIYGLMHNSLKMIQTPINSADRQSVQRFHQVVGGEIDADLANEGVIEALKQAVLEMPTAS
jgi:hypothetical protein